MQTRFSLAALLVALLALAPASLAQDKNQRPASLLDHAERSVSGDTEAVARKGGPAVVQLPDQANLFPSDTDCDLCSGQQSKADNLTFPSPFAVSDVTFWGGYFPFNLVQPGDFTIIFHSDDGGGLPGTATATVTSAPADCEQDTGVDLFGIDEYVYRIDFDTPVVLGAGVHHMEIFNNSAGNPESWVWETGTQDPEEGLPSSSFAFEAPGVTWYDVGGFSMAFALNAGTIYCTEGGEPEVDVDIGINTFTTNPMRGESVFFRGPVTNNGASPQFVYVYTEMDVPGFPNPFKRNIGGKTLAPGETFAYKNFPKSKNFFPLTPDAPAGTYTIRVYAASDRSGTEIYDQDSFSFELPPLPPCAGGCLTASVPTAASLEIVEPTAAPNPFRDATEIRYALAEAGEVDLRVYDVTGREVAALVSGTMSAGTHAATLRAGDLPGGVYVWRLAIGGEVTTGRVTLAR